MTTMFGDVVTHTIGGGWGKDSPADGDVAVRIIRGADFPEAERRDVSSFPVRFEPAKKTARRALRPGDIVLETSGGTRDRPTGRTVLIHETMTSASAEPLIPASFCRLVRVDQTKAVPAFVYYALQGLYSRGGTWEFQNTSTGISNFQYELFQRNFSLPAHSIAEQEAIVEVLGALDDKIAANTAFAATADELVRAEYAALSGRTMRVGDVADSPRSGVHPSTIDPHALYVGLEHLGRRNMWLSDGGEARDVTSAKSKFESDDVLFGKLRPYFHKVVAAPTAGICSTDIVVVRARNPWESSLLLAALSSDAVVEAVVAASEGTRMPRTSWKDLSAIEIRWPDPADLELVSSRLDAIRAAVASHLVESQTLTATRDALLPHLMSGKLRVRDAEQIASEAGA